jgi:hypothetical protein
MRLNHTKQFENDHNSFDRFKTKKICNLMAINNVPTSSVNGI